MAATPTGRPALSWNAGFENVDYEKITAPTLVVSPEIVGIATKAASRNNVSRPSALLKAGHETLETGLRPISGE